MKRKTLKDGFELAATRRTLPISLLRAREAVMERFRPLLSAHGVTEQQWRVLRILQEAERMDASELAEAACVLPPSLSRIIKTLEKKTYIAVAKDRDDGRRSQISLTPEGDTFLRRVAPESAAIYATIEAALGQDRIASLLDDIDVLLAALDRTS
ncbi:MAG: homoprotocatechuate degradation operon regulator HpaR [Pseudorhodobacter sp.]